ncbi:MAG: ATP-binding protein [Acetivibrio sp.]
MSIEQLPFKIEFEVAAIIIFIIILFYTYSGKNIPNLASRTYKIMVTVLFMTSILNLITVFTIANTREIPVELNYALNYLYLLIQNMAIPIWFFYVYELTEEKEKNWTSYLYSIPALLILISFFITPMTGYIFYFDKNKNYCLGPGMQILYLCALLYLFLSLVFTIKSRKNLNQSQKFAISFFIVTTGVSIILQAFIPKLMLVGFASAMACLVMYISLQNPEEQIDYTTGIFNRTAAITMISDYLKQGQEFSMIVLAIDQFKEINEKYGFEIGDLLLRNISKYLSNIVPNCIYRLEGDNITIIFQEEDITMEEIIDEIQKRFQKEWVIVEDSIPLSTCICCIYCPQDAKTVTEVLDTINNSIRDAKEIGKGTIIYACEHIENREKKISELEEQKRLLENISKEAEAARVEAERADRTKSIFLANMSHEIRTPMNAILGMTELVLRDEVSNQVRDNVENIRGAGESLRAIINDILDISKIESGKLEVVNDRYYLSSIIHDITNMVCARMLEKKVEFILEMDHNLPDELLGDEFRLRQILLNLLTNGVKFTQKGYVRLRLRGEVEDNTVNLHISVEDTGFGIKPEDQERLFESFARFDGTKTRQIEGTGLGLAICKQLLTLMGGKIHVESVYEKGSTFYVDLKQKIFSPKTIMEIENKELVKTLVILEDEQDNQMIYTLKNLEIMATYEVDSPMIWRMLKDVKFSHIFMSYTTYKKEKKCVDKLAKETKIIVIAEYGQYIERTGYLSVIQKPVYCLNVGESLNGTLQTNVKKKYQETFIAPEAKVLLVDDNEVNLKVAEGLLKPYQMQITKAFSGKECLELLKSKEYDLVFLDHMMPEMDGIETLLKIRENEDPYFKNLKVVALTANAIRGIREMFIENGFDDYISKPIDVGRLDEALRNNLPEERMRKDEERQKLLREEFPFEMQGVDTKKGVKNCSGSVNLYWELLNTVMLEGRIKHHLMKEYIATDNIKSYMVEAHALKSVAASLGAEELSMLAKKQEEEAKAENYVFIQTRGKDLLDVYEQFLNEVERVLKLHQKKETGKEQKSISQKEKEKIVKKIWNLVKEYEDEEALEGLNQLKNSKLSGTEEKKIQEILEALKVLNYTKASSLLEEWMETMDCEVQN